MTKEVFANCYHCNQWFTYSQATTRARPRKYCPRCAPRIKREQTKLRVRRFRAKQPRAPEPPMLSRRYRQHQHIVKAVLGKLFRQPDIAKNGDIITHNLTNWMTAKLDPSGTPTALPTGEKK